MRIIVAPMAIQAATLGVILCDTRTFLTVESIPGCRESFFCLMNPHKNRQTTGTIVLLKLVTTLRSSLMFCRYITWEQLASLNSYRTTHWDANLAFPVAHFVI